ncbi:exodeoxyribonuclease VII large subunit [Lacticaseibacillus thailandensis]|nr:exodeoxyribonuclease VII large subunit [Lacticaseibacillus thailandensis]
MATPDASEYLSVSMLNRYIKRKFDFDPYLKQVFVAGEVSNFRLRPAHQYFSLKDEHAKISAVMFKSAFQKLAFKLEDGMAVLAVGRVTVYEPSGNYQLTIERLEPAGQGVLALAYAQLNERLRKEGLYAIHDHTPLVQYPRKVAVVTSPSGAVIHDIITTVRRRYPQLAITLFPAQVQGDAAAPDIVRQLQRVDQYGGFDAVIIGRGGGSLEDLWPFNEEAVARAIVAMHIPVISSVGHETDVTIADYAADYRAATPTAAAEYVTPVTAAEAGQNVTKLAQRLVRAQSAILARLRYRLDRARQSVVLTQPSRLYDGQMQKLDLLRSRLFRSFPAQLAQLRSRLNLAQSRLQRSGLAARISSNQVTVANLQRRLGAATRATVQQRRQRVAQLAAALDSLSPLRTLSRGYAYTTDAQGHVLRTAHEYVVGADVTIHADHGSVDATIKTVNIEEEKHHE